MRKNTKKPKAVKFATGDCETNPFEFNAEIIPFMWGHYDGEIFSHFRDTDEYIEFISERDEILYFHNGGKFDMHFLLKAVQKETAVTVINGRIAVMKIGKCELRDSYLLLPVPLSAYEKDEIDYNKFHAEVREEHIDEITRYLMGDCKYLWNILNVQFQEYGHHLTLASSAFDYWYKNHSDLDERPKTSANYFAEFKPYYYGGRVECFERGVIDTDFEVHDINSAYPRAMLDNHAYGDEYFKSDQMPSPEELTRSFVEIRARSAGAFPFRCPDSGKLLFPNDDIIRNYKITGWELKTAIETNTCEVLDVVSSSVFFETINFRDYIHHFYELKAAEKEGDPAKYLLAKLYMNSLYGKFGQSPLDHRDYWVCSPDEIEAYLAMDYDFEGAFGQNALVSTPVPEFKHRFFNVATSASITGWVRSYLFRHILEAERPLYCDTDSLAAVKFKGELGKELGQWDKEGDFCRAAIGGKKLYCFVGKNGTKTKTKSKGVKLTEKEIFSVAKGNEVLYKNFAPTFSINKPPVYIERKVRATS